MNLHIEPSRVAGSVAVPGSKSHTIRAITGALLAEGTSTVRAPLESDDTASTLQAAVRLGARVEKTASNWRITGTGGRLSKPSGVLDMGNSGTGLRMLSAAAALLDSEVKFDGDASLRTRGMAPLLNALAQLGVRVTAAPGGHCPLSVHGPLQAGHAEVEAVCSQFLTALLFVGAYVENGLEITVTKLAEAPYVEITLAWLERLGVHFEATPDRMYFRIPGRQTFQAFDAVIPADFSTAAFPLGAGIVAGAGTGVTILNLDFSDAQGDKAVFDMLESLGAKLRRQPDSSVTVLPGSVLHSGVLDLAATPDALPLLAAVAASAPSGVTITLGNVAQARSKETDRIAGMTAELGKMGAKIEELPDGMVIHGTRLHGARVNCRKDHRLAMALAVAALGADSPSEIMDAEACAVTYPEFIEDFRKLGADFR